MSVFGLLQMPVCLCSVTGSLLAFLSPFWLGVLLASLQVVLCNPLNHAGIASRLALGCQRFDDEQPLLKGPFV